MSIDVLYSGYIPRSEESRIREQAALVQLDRQSRAVLLYGAGGVGKTTLVRALTQTGDDDDIVWLDPVDVDDSEYWLLSNLERRVARSIDPVDEYFAPYVDDLSRLPSQTRPRVGHDTVVSHLGRIKRVFVDCYKQFIQDTGKTVVIIFDTVEALRGMYFLLTLTQWMKALPGTLFILAGRPLPRDGGEDPIKKELDDPYQKLPAVTIPLGEFPEEDALTYLNGSNITADLPADDKARLVHMTRGHPLWLALAISYLQTSDIPEEASGPRELIEREIPFRGDLTGEGQIIYEAFKRRLVTPYKDTDFWHETVKRLAVVRQGVNKPIWQRLMADRPLPKDVPNLDFAWEKLLEIPWIRPRANGRFVTLHDALAEELALRIIPAHDQDQKWRRQLWRNAVRIYSELTERPEAHLNARLTASDEYFQQLQDRLRRQGDDSRSREEEIAYIQEVAVLDAEKREIDQFKAVRLFYLLLSDFGEGCRQFLELFEQASDQNDVLFEELLALEMQRFLPGGVHRYAFGDVIGQVINEFRRWLKAAGPEPYLEIGMTLADHLVKTQQPQTALELLDTLPLAGAGPYHRYRVNNLRGNAYMRIPGRVRVANDHFDEALREARALAEAGGRKLVAEAYKELGFYYRNEGMWEQADRSYKLARDEISATLVENGTAEDREEMASIQTNWAYVKGLVGSYREGLSLAESAISVRHRLNKSQEEGISWSVCAEVYRYERRFSKAWQAYAEAEEIFHLQKAWPWLGILYQEQAICLLQAKQDDIELVPEPLKRARELITWALDICRDQNVRGYPSALNRASRIVSLDDPQTGLKHLNEGIESAANLSDGWFLFANLIEYVELCYREWAKGGDQEYLDRIAAREPDITRVMAEYAFPDLRGRWDLLQGHLSVHQWLASGDDIWLSEALQRYERGFAQIAEGFVGSSGASALPGEFKTFHGVLAELPQDIQVDWPKRLRRAWSDRTNSTLLLACLEELY
jgi:tetratricopeptide (TPR) repeat protein